MYVQREAESSVRLASVQEDEKKRPRCFIREPVVRAWVRDEWKEAAGKPRGNSEEQKMSTAIAIHAAAPRQSPITTP